MAEPVLEAEKDHKETRLVEGQAMKDLIKLKAEFSNMSLFLWASLGWFLS